MTEKKEKSFLRRFGGAIGFIVILGLFAGLFFQNGSMIKKMNKLLSDNDIKIHEIYDDTAVIEAYKKGSKDGLDEEEAFLYDTLMETIPEITKEGMSDYEKEKAAYEWVFGLTHLNEDSLNPMNGGNTSGENYRPYDVIKNHDAICVGNATTFKLMMDAMDIPCMIVHSTQEGEHAWDVVQLDDEWYHVDVTFDGGASEPSYSGFNLPDSIKDDGAWPYDHDVIPKCNGTKYCYLFMNAKEVKNMYGIPKAIAEGRDNGEGFVSVIPKSTKGLTEAIAQYIGSSVLVENGEITYMGTYSIDGKAVLVYQIMKWTDEENGGIPEDVIEKLTPRIEKANEGVSGGGYDDYMSDELSDFAGDPVG